MNLRAALLRGWVAFRDWRVRLVERRTGTDPRFGEMPWLTVGAFVLVALCAWFRYRMDWVTMVGFAASTFNFYLWGRNVQNRINQAAFAETHASYMRAHQSAHETFMRLAGAMRAYRRLYSHHHAMTGEAYRDPEWASPETHDA